MVRQLSRSYESKVTDGSAGIEEFKSKNVAKLSISYDWKVTDGNAAIGSLRLDMYIWTHVQL